MNGVHWKKRNKKTVPQTDPVGEQAGMGHNDAVPTVLPMHMNMKDATAETSQGSGWVDPRGPPNDRPVDKPSKTKGKRQARPARTKSRSEARQAKPGAKARPIALGRWVDPRGPPNDRPIDKPAKLKGNSQAGPARTKSKSQARPARTKSKSQARPAKTEGNSQADRFRSVGGPQRLVRQAVRTSGVHPPTESNQHDHKHI